MNRFQFEENRICQLLGIKYPIIQAGMVWCSGWKLAKEVSEYGGLGTIGAGSMYPEILHEHLTKIKQALGADIPFAVNLPLLYPQIQEHISLIIEHQVPVVITSAGNPKLWTDKLKSHGIKVLHVVSSVKFALKAQEAGVDAVIAEGFEAGGHNGREELTTFVLVPAVSEVCSVPVIAAGGIKDGKSMLAAMVLGAEGVQIGSRFVCSNESSAHENFKQSIVNSPEDATFLTLKELTPVRLLKNNFYEQVLQAYQRKASVEELKNLLGKGRSKKGMFEGDLNEGELEIGQVAGYIKEILPAKVIMKNILTEYEQIFQKLKNK
ncbi:MAG: 2-nitropropane dioxygenase [Bacteroidia bacterium]|nr:MAG: 2-nitropropane dioxygenase [Bacteroidia bacterium]